MGMMRQIEHALRPDLGRVENAKQTKRLGHDFRRGQIVRDFPRQRQHRSVADVTRPVAVRGVDRAPKPSARARAIA